MFKLQLQTPQVPSIRNSTGIDKRKQLLKRHFSKELLLLFGGHDMNLHLVRYSKVGLKKEKK
jgi:hypothetical protein